MFRVWWIWVLIVAVPVLGKDIIRHRGFNDFIKGRLEDGGASLYVSRQGTIEIIPRWDLNGDGRVDLLMNQDHNQIENVDAFLYWGTPNGFQSVFPPFWKEQPAFKLMREIRRSERNVTLLPTYGGGPVRIADLDRDGYPDIIFTNTIHNYSMLMPAYIYWGGPDGYSTRHRTELPTLFALDVAVADLNRDGYPDLVFANFGREAGDRWGYHGNRESYIYWGGAEGFAVERRTSIPTVSAIACAAGDVNGDGWPDLVFANNNLKQRSLLVYLGGKGGFSPQRSLSLDGGDPGVVQLADADGDGIDDVIVDYRGQGITIFPGSTNFQLHKRTVLPAEAVKSLYVGDLNKDGHPEIVVAAGSGDARKASTDSYIYWGSAGGFQVAKRQTLPTLWPTAVTCADVNGDGFPDILFANSRTDDTFDVPSFIYWGAADGYHASRRAEVQGFGAAGVAAGDLNHDGLPDLILVNQISGGVQDHTPSVIFWGNTAHTYSAADATLLAASGPYFSRIADLNGDGYPDIVFTGSTAYIWWGSAQGFRKRTPLELASFGVTIGDFNRDGYLDLVFLTWSSDPRVNNEGVVVWGGAEGFHLKSSTRIPLAYATRASAGVATADLNKDGWLDLVFPAGESTSKASEIVWGGAKGFGAMPNTVLHTNMVDSPSIADLNGDGWLDIIFPGNADFDTQNPHTQSLIYWGGANGYSDANRSGFEAYSSMEIEAADLNHDGYLDLVASNYKAETTRHLPVFIYWGNAGHAYGKEHRTELPAESSCGIQLLDLNEDGYSDIVVHNHIKDGDHTFGAYIYWGGKAGYSIERRSPLPTMGTHYAMGTSPGNIYDRKPAFSYLSAPVPVRSGSKRLTLEWRGQTPHKTTLNFQFRAASSTQSLPAAEWKDVARGQTWELPAGSTLVQYRAVLGSPGGANSPRLEEVVLHVE